MISDVALQCLIPGTFQVRALPESEIKYILQKMSEQ
jgi:hypothetical protein